MIAVWLALTSPGASDSPFYKVQLVVDNLLALSKDISVTSAANSTPANITSK